VEDLNAFLKTEKTEREREPFGIKRKEVWG
jgi:hypothetical protein